MILRVRISEKTSRCSMYAKDLGFDWSFTAPCFGRVFFTQKNRGSLNHVGFGFLVYMQATKTTQKQVNISAPSKGCQLNPKGW